MKSSNSYIGDFSALVDFSKLINSSLDLNFTLNNLLLTCMGKLLATSGAVYLLNEKNEFELNLFKGAKIKGGTPPAVFSFSDYSDEKKRKFIFNDKYFPVVIELTGANGLVGLLILGKKLNRENYSEQDKRFLSTIANISVTAIENSRAFLEKQELNRRLTTKVNQLSTLFELSKEFGGTLDVKRVARLLIYSLIGQLMVAEFAIVLCNEKEIEILETKFDEKELTGALNNYENFQFNDTLNRKELEENFPELNELGVRLIIPMKFKGETKGLILLGKRRNNLEYSASDVEFASSVSGIAVISIENSKMVEQIVEKRKMEKELETARNIQKSLLPQSLPELKNFDIAGISESARQVGGDYYDVIPLDENRTLIAIGDVSGKGVQAALLMANLQAFLKSISKQNIPLNKATGLINDLVSENTRMGNFITFFWGILDDSTGKFQYVNAGHNPPYLIYKDEIRLLKTGGMLLGVTKTLTPYKAEEVVLKPSSRLVLFTDGITEAMNYSFEEYGEERLKELVMNFHGSSESLITAILDDVKRHSNGREQYDDITCVVVSARVKE